MTRWRLLVDYWRRRKEEKRESHANDANDQALANLVLIRQYGLHGLDGCRKRRGCMAETAFFDDYPRNASIPSPRITLLDRDADGRQNALITGADRFVTNGSYAVHAFGNANHSAKLIYGARPREALVVEARTLGRGCAPRHPGGELRRRLENASATAQ